MTDPYQELLAALESDEPVVVQSHVATRKIGPRQFNIEHTTKFNATYTSEQVQALIGFAISVLVSVAVHASSSLSVALTDPDLMAGKLEKYMQMGRDNPEVTLPPGTEELCRQFTVATAHGMQAVIDSEMNSDSDIIDGVRFNAMVATVMTTYMLGRHTQHFMPEKSETVSREDLVAALAQATINAYEIKTILGEDDVQKKLTALFNTLLDDPLVQDVEQGRISPEDFLKAARDHVERKQEGK